MGLASTLRPCVRSWIPQTQQRTFQCAAVARSGHNRWSKISHDKAKNDAVKSRERTWLSQEVYLASKFGGPDPALNSRLVTAIANAKRGQLSKSSIEAAIAKGQGKSISGASLETVTVEALLPFNVAAIIEYHTESKTRILHEVRHIIKEYGGSVTPTSFFFDRKGKIWFETKPDQAGDLEVDDVTMDAAIEAGAQDISIEAGARAGEEQNAVTNVNMVVVETAPSDVTAVATKIESALGLKVHKTDILYDPKTETAVSLSEDEHEQIAKIVGLIEEESSLQAIYLNAV